MSSINKEAKKEAQIFINPLNQNVLREKMNAWNSILSSCYGPKGKPIAIQNTIGGQVNITRSSARLFELVRPSDPFLQIIISTVKCHVRQYDDFGIFTALFIIELLKSFEKVNLPQTTKANLVEYFGKIIVDHLSDEETRCCKMKVDLTDLKNLMTVVKSIINSKMLPILSRDEVNFISSLVLEAFLSLIPSSGEKEILQLGQLHFLQHEGLSVSHSTFYSGFLHRVPPNIGTKVPTNFKTTNHRIALFNVSLAGDLSLYVNVTYEVSDSHAVEDAVLQQLLLLIEKLVSLEVSVLACQKVVHPKLFKFCRSHGIIVLERLGENGCRTFAELTGCKPISSLNEGLNVDNLGNADSLTFVSLFEKNYVHVQNGSSTVGSVLLCHTNEECLTELSVVFKQGFRSLVLLLSKPEVLIGGGCLHQHLMQLVRKKTFHELKDESLCAQLELTNGQVIEALRGFNRTQRRMSISLIDDECRNLESQEDHFWDALESSVAGNNRKCACKCLADCKNIRELDGIKELSWNEDSVVDVALAKLAAMKTAFELTSMLLRVGVCVIDRN